MLCLEKLVLILLLMIFNPTYHLFMFFMSTGRLNAQVSLFLLANIQFHWHICINSLNFEVWVPNTCNLLYMYQFDVPYSLMFFLHHFKFRFLCSCQYVSLDLMFYSFLSTPQITVIKLQSIANCHQQLQQSMTACHCKYIYVFQTLKLPYPLTSSTQTKKCPLGKLITDGRKYLKPTFVKTQTYMFPASFS